MFKINCEKGCQTPESQLFLRIASKHLWCKPLKTEYDKVSYDTFSFSLVVTHENKCLINKIGNSIKEFPIFLWVEKAILIASTD